MLSTSSSKFRVICQILKSYDEMFLFRLYGCTLRDDVCILNRRAAAANVHTTLTRFTDCRVHCAKVVGATSSEGFLFLSIFGVSTCCAHVLSLKHESDSREKMRWPSQKDLSDLQSEVRFVFHTENMDRQPQIYVRYAISPSESDIIATYNNCINCTFIPMVVAVNGHCFSGDVHVIHHNFYYIRTCYFSQC